MIEGPSLGDGLVWAVFCPLFTGDFDAVTNFLTPFWSDYEGVTPRLSTWRVMWHVLIHVDLLILLIAVSFKYQSATSTSIFKETPSHGWNIGSERSRCHMPISVSNAYRPCFPEVASYDTPLQWLMYPCDPSLCSFILELPSTGS